MWDWFVLLILVLYDKSSQLIFKWKNQDATNKVLPRKQIYNLYTTKHTCFENLKEQSSRRWNLFGIHLGEKKKQSKFYTFFSFIIVLHSEWVINVNIDMWPSNRDQNRFVSFTSKKISTWPSNLEHLALCPLNRENIDTWPSNREQHRHVTFKSRTTSTCNLQIDMWPSNREQHRFVSFK